MSKVCDELIEKMNDKQRKFCEQFFLLSSATEAAEAAGYSKKSSRSTASKLLNHPLISQYIDEVRKEESKKAKFTREDYRDLIIKLAKGEIEETESISGLDRGQPTDKTHRKSARTEGLKMVAKYFGWEAPEKVDVNVSGFTVNLIPATQTEDQEEE